MACACRPMVTRQCGLSLDHHQGAGDGASGTDQRTYWDWLNITRLGEEHVESPSGVTACSLLLWPLFRPEADEVTWLQLLKIIFLTSVFSAGELAIEVEFCRYS